RWPAQQAQPKGYMSRTLTLPQIPTPPCSAPARCSALLPVPGSGDRQATSLARRSRAFVGGRRAALGLL
uniref:Uncharacterized protein n=1 Tax=Aegilops tauschii subsp. strangulata TaxID=200361 RepID=A0A453ABI2_AEGTS